MRSPPPSYRSFLRQKSLREHQARRHAQQSAPPSGQSVIAPCDEHSNNSIIYNKQNSVPLDGQRLVVGGHEVNQGVRSQEVIRDVPGHSHMASGGPRTVPTTGKRVNFASEPRTQRKHTSHSVMV